MKKYIGAAAVVGLCLMQGTAVGQTSEPACFQTLNQGGATVALGAYEQSCATITWSSGVITKDVKYNCCAPVATIRVHGNDWNKLVDEGKLDGLRYQRISKDSNGAYVLEFRKIVGKQPTSINPADFN
ncbi:hypothetical protein [Hyalangium minutum]|uniref:Lipoprotein n=1 Tax=Hyalangium minutum TaxID=394096 RepID=A0A085W4K2_9BACT|nr:hypothetical protein [Hyalangium minutum]KFE62615.1 hypothetical protein DB31_3729 [Hyalangium minutum]